MDKQLRQHLDIVNDRICPFCLTALVGRETGLDGSTILGYYSCDNHLSIGYDRMHGGKGDWTVIRVSPQGFDRFTFRVWHLADMYEIMVNGKQNDPITKLPPFPLFQYSLEELADKIKTYVVFS